MGFWAVIKLSSTRPGRGWPQAKERGLSLGNTLIQRILTVSVMVLGWGSDGGVRSDRMLLLESAWVRERPKRRKALAVGNELFRAPPGTRVVIRVKLFGGEKCSGVQWWPRTPAESVCGWPQVASSGRESRFSRLDARRGTVPNWNADGRLNVGLSMGRGIGREGTSRLLRETRHSGAVAGPIDAEAAAMLDAGDQGRPARG